MAEDSTPIGVVTFLVTDVVASTRLWRESPLAGAALARQAELIAAAVGRHGGVRPPDQGEGDSSLAAFARPADALAAALDAQRSLAAEPWPDAAEVSVRMAVHTGDAQLRDGGNYGGLAIIRAARIRALAHGGQILVSSATAALAEDALPEGASLVEVGSAALPGFARPERLHELSHGDLPAHAGRLGQLRASPAASLAPWPTSLVGRERERRELGALLETHPFVTITGAGGSGKTRLAHAIAEDRADRHADGIVWVELARTSDPAQVAPAVVAACGLLEAPGATPLQVLSSRLAKAEVLVVLDNCEHLLEACAELAEAMVRAGQGVRVLATSREPLGAAGEIMWRIPSLGTAPEDERSVERIAEYDAVKLFVERARAAGSDLQLDDANAHLVARICRRLDGIPLALELAAARLRALSLERLAEGLDDRFRLLTGGARTAVARQRTLLASVEWSHDLLEASEKALFGRLAVFAAPFTLDAAEFVAADGELDRTEVFDLLARLVDKSLVQHRGDRYWLLETLRQYGLEHGDARELAAARDRHLAWFRRRAESWAADREILTQRAADEIAAEKPDLIAAIDWSLGPGRAPAIALLHPLGATWPWTAAYAEARSVSERVLACFAPGTPEWLGALAPVSFARFMSGDVALAVNAAAALAEHGDSISPMARSQLESTVAWGLVFVGRREGLAGLERAIASARAAGSRAIEVSATLNLAFLYAASDPRRAQPLLAWLERQTPVDAAFRWTLDLVVGATALMVWDFATARARISPRHPGALPWLVHLALQTGDRGPLREAHAILARAGEVGVFEGGEQLVAVVDEILRGDFAAARDRLRAARWQGAYTVPYSLGISLALALGDAADAETLHREIQGRFADTAFISVHRYGELARAYGARGRSSAEAESAAQTALAESVELGLVGLQVEALELLALLSVDAGRLSEAGRLIGAADVFRARTGAQRALPLAGFDALRAKVGTAAIEEGARLSLDDAIAYARRGRGERGRPASGWDSLTPAEQRVVELVGEGLPNAAIAKKLFVSVATVKTHLLHVYGKLGLATRAELAAAVTARRIANRPERWSNPA